MTRIQDIQRFPTLLTGNDYKDTVVHESVLRSFQIVKYVKELLEKNTPQDVILDIILTLEKETENEQNKEEQGNLH